MVRGATDGRFWAPLTLVTIVTSSAIPGNVEMACGVGNERHRFSKPGNDWAHLADTTAAVVVVLEAPDRCPEGRRK